MHEMNTVRGKDGKEDSSPMIGNVHPAWVALIRHCQKMGHGEIERIKIQDGIPVLIEKSVEKIKLS